MLTYERRTLLDWGQRDGKRKLNVYKVSIWEAANYVFNGYSFLFTTG